VIILGFSANIDAQRSYKQTITLKTGEYLFNSTDLYFFDDGIDCYLLKKCNDIDTVFSNNAQTLKVSKDSTIKYQAYLFTDNYEYVYAKINVKEGWLRVDVPINSSAKDFIKSMLLSVNYDSYSSYIEIVPFKNPKQVFVSTTDYWNILDLDKLTSVQIGSKGGRLEACQMIYPKNCVKCYIDLGWGQEVIYDAKGRKKKVK